MDIPSGRSAWMVKIDASGRFTIPEEARERFGRMPNSTMLLLGDDRHGLVILPKEEQEKFMQKLCKVQEEKKKKGQ